MIVMAMDRASCRSFDIDGRLHIDKTNISKATVNPYMGREIPGFASMGLDPDRVYHLFRHPDELAAAAPTFNNLPVLNVHVEVSADDHKPENVVGSTGTHAAFDGTYLTNSAVVWARDSIDLIESDEQREWSCAYRYTPEMTPGIFGGCKYDGIMRNIVGNHVALVTEGRAGPDVVVGDSKMRRSATVLMLHGAVAAIVAPKLATDAAVNFTDLLKNLTAENLPVRRKTLAAQIVEQTNGKLAADAKLDVADVTLAIDAALAIDAKDDDDDDKKAMDEDDDDKKAMDGDEDEDDDKKTAKDGDEPPASKKEGAPTMDAAAIRRELRAEMNAIRTAEREVHPIIGDIDTLPDTASGVYKLALDAKGVDVKGVHTSAYRAMVGMLSKADAPRIAADQAGRGSAQAEFDKMYPSNGKAR